MEQKPKNSKAKIAANSRYNAKNYESLTFRVKKGERAKIQQLSMQSGESVASYIKKAISVRATADGQPDPFRE